MKYVLLLFLQFTVLQAKAQALEGVYINQLPAENNVYSYQFNNSRFKTIEHIHSNRIIKGGYFIVDQDSLVLVYQALEDPAASAYKVLEKKDIKPSLSFLKGANEGTLLSFKVQTLEGQNLPGVHMVVYNEQEEPVLAFSSNEQGKYPELSFYSSRLSKVKFSFIGYKPLELELDSLRGYNTTVLIRLSNNTDYYGEVEGIKKYKIGEIKKNQFSILKARGQKVVYKRE